MGWGEVAFSGNKAVVLSSNEVFVVSRGVGAATARIPIAGNAIRSVVRYRDGDSERLFVDFGKFYLLDPETGRPVRKDPPLRIRAEPPAARLRVGRGSGLAVRVGERPVCYFVVSAGKEESYISCLFVQTFLGSEIHSYLRVLLWSEEAGVVALESDTRVSSEFPPVDLAGGTIAVVPWEWAYPMVNLVRRGVLNEIHGIWRYWHAKTCTLSSDGQAMACMVRMFSGGPVRAVWADLSWLARQTTPPSADQQSIRVSSLYLPEELGDLSPHQIRPIRIAPTLDWGVVEITDGEDQARTFVPVELRWEDPEQPSGQRG